jgi:hypothetical protein
MGTNFYQESEPCKCCGAVKEKKHIGKSSAGWAFVFAAYEENTPVTFQEWKEELQKDGYKIYDEYGKEYSTQEFLERVESFQAHAEESKRLDVNSDVYYDRKGYRLCRRGFN